MKARCIAVATRHLAVPALLGAMALASACGQGSDGRPSPAAGGDLSPRTGQPSRCQPRQLHIEVADVATDPAGAVARLDVRNASAEACFLRGFVHVRMLDAQNRPLPTSVLSDYQAPQPMVVLDPAGHAVLRLHWATACPAMMSRVPDAWQIVPPSETRPIIVSAHPARVQMVAVCNQTVTVDPLTAE